MQEQDPNKRPKRKRTGNKPLIVYKWKDEEEIARLKLAEQNQEEASPLNTMHQPSNN